MYPNQQPQHNQMAPQNVGFYVPPPTFGNNSYMGGPTGFQQFQSGNVNDMLSDMIYERFGETYHAFNEYRIVEIPVKGEL